MGIHAQLYAEAVAREVIGMIDKRLVKDGTVLPTSEDVRAVLLELRAEVDKIRSAAEKGYY